MGMPSTWLSMLCGHVFGARTQIENRLVPAQPICGLSHLQSFHMINGLINLQGRKGKEKKRGAGGKEGDWIN